MTILINFLSLVGLLPQTYCLGLQMPLVRSPFGRFVAFVETFFRWTGVPNQTEAHSGALYELNVA